MAITLFEKVSAGEQIRPIAITATISAGLGVTHAGGLAGASSVTYGVAASSGVSGDTIPVVVNALSTPVVAGAAIAVGAPVTTNSSGKFITAVTTKNVFGRALEAAGADGDLISIEITKEGLLTIPA